MNGFLKHFSKWDKDTFVFGAVFLLVMVGLMRVKADPIYFIGAGCAFIVLYVCMRYALLRAQEMEREANFKRLPQRKAREIVDANATKSEKLTLDKFRDSVKTRRK